MTVFLIFVFFGFFFLLLCSVFGLWLLVSDQSRLIEIGICVLGILIIAVPTIAVAWHLWQQLTMH